MKPQIEIEIKAHLNNRADVEAKLKALGAIYKGKKHQIDYYFSRLIKAWWARGFTFAFATTSFQANRAWNITRLKRVSAMPQRSMK